MDDLCDALATHPERGRRLYWLEAISDEYLEMVYAASSCLLAASQGEGFGLPLIEAAQRGMPVLARDIPVFREVAGECAHYFDGLGPDTLAAAVLRWIEAEQANAVPDMSKLRWLTWRESAKQLEAALFAPRRGDGEVVHMQYDPPGFVGVADQMLSAEDASVSGHAAGRRDALS
jgi:glycosyltransferase involved in cell wall biosynthesis